MATVPKNDITIATAMIGIDGTEDYDKIIEYGTKSFYKMRNGYPSLPGDKEFAAWIVSQAMVEAVFSFRPDEGAQFKTYFYSKILGVITKYIKKGESTQNYGKHLLKSGEVVLTVEKDGDVSSDSITDGDLAEFIDQEEALQRRMTATRMAKSDLPMLLQRVLYAILEYDKTSEASQVLNMPTNEIKALRNNALSLMLKKVIRSKHLHTEEQDEIKKEYQLI